MAEGVGKTTAETSEFVRNLALGIASELERQGTSVSELAQASGISRHILQRFLRRDCGIDLIAIEQICLALNADPHNIFKRGRDLWRERSTRRAIYIPPIFIMPFPGE